MKQPCVGCGILSDAHPVVAVMLPSDVPEGVPQSIPGPNGFVAVPCCHKCWTEPDQRPRPIKGHFFLAKDAPAGIFHAGSNSQVGGH